MSNETVDHGTWVISNEFAAVSLRRVQTRNGERLEITSLGHEHSIQLDAITLEALTWSTPLEVGKGLETPFGPDPSEPQHTDATARTENDERDA
ncbi:hypothetical protein [Georgenia sp. Z1491]|uniref:hypothetical protein n=1 Tax=Georgenia sp. Z1491 TaxID=3416707 RepID=UPI003CF2B753